MTSPTARARPRTTLNLDQIEMRVRRREDFDAIDGLVGEDRIETGGERKWTRRT